jgi:hypothetical protein
MKFYPLRTEGTNTYSGDTLIVLSRTKPKVTEMCSKCWDDNAKMLESSASKIQSVSSRNKSILGVYTNIIIGNIYHPYRRHQAWSNSVVTR